MSIHVKFLAASLLILSACGSPAGPQNETPAGSGMRMDRFKMRYQAGSERFVEITGDSAALSGSDRMAMDSVALAFYRDNLEFLRLTAKTAQARMAAKDSGSVTLSDADGKFYYGGQFRAKTLKLSFEEGSWLAAGSVTFQRPPMNLSASAAYGPLSMEEVRAKDAKIQAEGSIASGDHMLLWPGRRLLFLQGRASYASDTVNRRGDTIALQIDPTYSRLAPVK